MAALLRAKQVTARLSVSSSTLYQMIKDGRFPKGKALSTRTVVWTEAQLDGWIADQLAD